MRLKTFQHESKGKFQKLEKTPTNKNTFATYFMSTCWGGREICYVLWSTMLDSDSSNTHIILLSLLTISNNSMSISALGGFALPPLCMPSYLLFMYFVAGQEFQIAHVCPGQFPALLSQVFKRRVLTRRSYKIKEQQL